MKKINNIFNTANKSLFAIGDTSRRSTPDSSGQRRILLSSCCGPISPLARGVPARAGCRKFGVWFAALVALFVATPSFAEPTELDKKTVASKAYVDTKQDKITTGLVDYYSIADQETKQVPSLVSYDSTNGLVGNEIGILDWFNIDNDVWENLTSSEMDNFVPTVRAVAGGLVYKQDILPAAWTSTTSYSNMASTGGQTIELNTDGNVKRRYITAGGNEALTLKSGADNVILYINGTKTLEEFQISNFLNATGTQITENQNYIKGALVSLELLKDVYSALHNEIQNATPTGTPGNVAMYDASTGELGDGVATYDGSTTYNASTDADKIAVMSGVQRKKECGGYEPGHENDPDYCWLWIFPD